MTAVPLNRGAGVVTSFVKADGIIRVPQDREGYEAGRDGAGGTAAPRWRRSCACSSSPAAMTR